MFEKIKRIMARGRASADHNGQTHNGNASVAHERQNTAATQNKPNLATTRTNIPQTATRDRSNATFGPPPAAAVIAAKRSNTAENGAAPANLQRDNRRIEKAPRHAEQVKGGQFIDTATAGGERHLRQAKAKEVQFKTKQGLADGISLRYRSGSVTGLQLSPDASKVTAAFHTSVTTGETTQIKARQMRGKTAKVLNQVAKKRDNRNLEGE